MSFEERLAELERRVEELEKREALGRAWTESLGYPKPLPLKGIDMIRECK